MPSHPAIRIEFCNSNLQNFQRTEKHTEPYYESINNQIYTTEQYSFNRSILSKRKGQMELWRLRFHYVFNGYYTMVSKVVHLDDKTVWMYKTLTDVHIRDSLRLWLNTRGTLGCYKVFQPGCYFQKRFPYNNTSFSDVFILWDFIYMFIL